jgi:hypothetical protein
MYKRITLAFEMHPCWGPVWIPHQLHCNSNPVHSLTECLWRGVQNLQHKPDYFLTYCPTLQLHRIKWLTTYGSWDDHLSPHTSFILKKKKDHRSKQDICVHTYKEWPLVQVYHSAQQVKVTWGISATHNDNTWPLKPVQFITKNKSNTTDDVCSVT